MSILIWKLKSLSLFFIILILGSNIVAQKPAIEWVSIPAGNFSMGSPLTEVDRKDDEVNHEVNLSAFKMSKYEITAALFKAFIISTGYVTDADKGTGGVKGSLIWTGESSEMKAGVNWKCDGKGRLRPGNEYNHPVLHVSWNDAKAFADWMGCRLPTEAEWEYACRAGTVTPFNTGDNITTYQANYDGDFPYNKNALGVYRGKTMPVGSFSPNSFGLYDMHGNAWEWCGDWHGDYPRTNVTNPTGPSFGTLHIIRGGSWENRGRYCRSANRDSYYPGYRDYTLGFRIVSNK